MPDISMCENKNCLKRNKCYRFTATPSQYQQSYAQFGDLSGNTFDGCDSFMYNHDFIPRIPKKRKQS